MDHLKYMDEPEAYDLIQLLLVKIPSAKRQKLQIHKTVYTIQYHI